MFVGCVFSWYYLKCTFFRTSINRNWLLFMEFDTLSRLNDILQIPFFSLSFLLLSQLFYGFIFFFSFRSIFVCSVVHTSCTHFVRMLSWHLYIYWSEDEEKKTQSHEYRLENPIKWRLYHVLMSFRGRLTKGVYNSIHKNSFQVK